VTVRLEIKPGTEANLAAQARAKGAALDAYLQDLIVELARTQAPAPGSLEDLRGTLDAVAEMGGGPPHLPSSANSRESIYRDHDRGLACRY
jgi:hypothetical protein